MAKPGMLIVLRKTLRRAVPLQLRRSAALVRRELRDRLDGSQVRLARSIEPSSDLPQVVVIEQPIRQGPMWQGKLANLQRGVAALNRVRIAPGEIFSFWAWLGQPSTARGFAIGRAIRDDEATGDPGGGLCQLSGIVYELGLRGGLHLIERHAHSRDLYQTETERFTALGLDATVVWPWKDLRLENRHQSPVVLRFAIEGLTLRAWMQCDLPIEPASLVVNRTDHAAYREVEVLRMGEPVSLDRYAV